MNTFQALQILQVEQGSSPVEIKASYRKLALKLHPDKNQSKGSEEFKRLTIAYAWLKVNPTSKPIKIKPPKKQPRSGAPQDGSIPEQDWSKFTQKIETDNPNFWKEYESKFWESYNERLNTKKETTIKPKDEQNLFVEVDKSLCIGCCSCESIAPGVFKIDKQTRFNPKSSVINPQGAGVDRIISAAATCPTKAILVENANTHERLFPY